MDKEGKLVMPENAIPYENGDLHHVSYLEKFEPNSQEGKVAKFRRERTQIIDGKRNDAGRNIN